MVDFFPLFTGCAIFLVGSKARVIFKRAEFQWRPNFMRSNVTNYFEIGNVNRNQHHHTPPKQFWNVPNEIECWAKYWSSLFKQWIEWLITKCASNWIDYQTADNAPNKQTSKRTIVQTSNLDSAILLLEYIYFRQKKEKNKRRTHKNFDASKFTQNAEPEKHTENKKSILFHI